MRRWFIQQEVDLFRYRFSELHSKQKLEFLHRNNLQYDAVSVSLSVLFLKKTEFYLKYKKKKSLKYTFILAAVYSAVIHFQEFVSKFESVSKRSFKFGCEFYRILQ